MYTVPRTAQFTYIARFSCCRLQAPDGGPVSGSCGQACPFHGRGLDRCMPERGNPNPLFLDGPR